jgi:hypothetical protein
LRVGQKAGSAHRAVLVAGGGGGERRPSGQAKPPDRVDFPRALPALRTATARPIAAQALAFRARPKHLRYYVKLISISKIISNKIFKSFNCIFDSFKIVMYCIALLQFLINYSWFSLLLLKIVCDQLKFDSVIPFGAARQFEPQAGNCMIGE